MLLVKKVISAPVICTHCGEDCEEEPIMFHQKAFCCQGCKTIFELFTENGLDDYYSLNKTPGISPNKNAERFAFLDNEQLIERLSDYTDEDNLRITLEIPSIHCSSCIWLLENLHRLDDGVRYCHVNFGKQELSLLLDTKKTSLRTNVELLSRIGYEPSIRLDKLDKKATKKRDYGRWYKIGIAGFCFGNIMLLTLPEYFDPTIALDRNYSVFFRVMNVVLSLPALLYVSPEYFVSAWKSIRAKVWNIDVPIALGIAVIFLRSLFEIITNNGPGYLDSLCGLVFFMSIGRAFQKITYDGLNFDRDYTSYFPVSVEVSVNGKDEYVPITQLKVGQVIRLRNGEICPGDATLLSIKSVFDSSFVTGESKPVEKEYNSKIFAGLKNIGASAELRIEKEVSQSYLTGLWNNKAYQKQTSEIQSLTDTLSHYFTPAIIAVALISFFIYAIQNDWATAWNALTAVLIVACPCALALASPFAMGNALRILGRNHFFVKNAISLETLASINHIVFDKTGTLTQNGKEDIEWKGRSLSISEQEMLASLLKQSGHPLSRGVYGYVEMQGNLSIQNFEEREGKGIYGEINGHKLWIGSQSWCNMVPDQSMAGATSVWIRLDGDILGVFNFNNRYRKNLKETISQFHRDISFSILSGDNPSEKARLETVFPAYTRYRFQSLPDEKSTYINELKRHGYKVAMVGDGLNDSGALMCADMGISVSDNLNTFSPASDAILDGKYFSALPKFIGFAKKTRQVIKWGFTISLLYNCIGLYLAVTGNLSPVLAAILMPLSSITVISFVTVTLNILARRMKF